MRIGLVLEQFDPARGGREQWTWLFTQRLLELGHEVHIVARSCASKARRLPIACHPVQCDPSPIAFAGAVRNVLEPLALDIVHDMGMGWYCDVFHPHGGSMASSAERKLLFLPAWLRGLKRMANRMLPRHRTFQTLMQRQYADHGQVVLALSRASAADFQRFHGVAPERIRLVYNGVDTERFSPEQCRPLRQQARQRLGLPAETVMALIVAHNFRLKGVATLLGTIRRLQTAGREVRLAIVGGKHIDSWRRSVAR
ncbi:MAG: glycosyltransferase family 4 protein, partial [Thermoguttaceae bacterium]